MPRLMLLLVLTYCNSFTPRGENSKEVEGYQKKDKSQKKTKLVSRPLSFVYHVLTTAAVVARPKPRSTYSRTTQRVTYNLFLVLQLQVSGPQKAGRRRERFEIRRWAKVEMISPLRLCFLPYCSTLCASLPILASYCIFSTAILAMAPAE